MIRTHILPCALPRAVADALNRASGAIYTQVLVTMLCEMFTHGLRSSLAVQNAWKAGEN